MLVANWVEASQGLLIDDLEATGSNHDLVAVSPDGDASVYEIKFIGTSDADFEELSKKDIFGGAMDVYTASDYLLTRIYEAAQQAKSHADRKIIIIVIDEQMAWPVFQAALLL